MWKEVGLETHGGKDQEDMKSLHNLFGPRKDPAQGAAKGHLRVQVLSRVMVCADVCGLSLQAMWISFIGLDCCLSLR